jgi:hypothetical protein
MADNKTEVLQEPSLNGFKGCSLPVEAFLFYWDENAAKLSLASVK